MDIDTHVTLEAIEEKKLLRFVSRSGHGAHSLFVGVVRDANGGRAVSAVSYDGFAPLAQKVLEEISREAVQQWGVRVAAAHRLGRLPVGETSLAVAVGSAHREPAFAACRYVVEEIKKRLPVWKKEHYVGGDEVWLEGCSLHGSQETVPVEGQ